LVAEPVGGVGGADGGAGHGGERGGTGGVGGAGGGEQDPGEPLPGGGDLVTDAVAGASVAGGRIHHHRPAGPGLGEAPGVGAVQGHRRGIGGKDAARPRGPGAVDHSGYSTLSGTVSHTAPSATITSGISAVIRRRAASAAGTVPHARSSPSVTA